jgi:hypothetical protein
MAEIATATGAIVTIDDDAVTMVTGPYPADKGKRCYLHGLQKGAIPVNDDAKTIVSLLHPKMAFVALTRPDGTGVWVKGDAVSAISQPTAADIPKGLVVGAVLTVSGEHQAVQEAVATVQNKLGRKTA